MFEYIMQFCNIKYPKTPVHKEVFKSGKDLGSRMPFRSTVLRSYSLASFILIALMLHKGLPQTQLPCPWTSQHPELWTR